MRYTQAEGGESGKDRIHQRIPCLRHTQIVLTLKARGFIIRVCDNSTHAQGGYEAMKHGGKGTKLYAVWCDMRKRCNTPTHHAYKYYGGKGVKVCEEWNDFSVFREWAVSHGYAEGLTIDRKESNGNYCPDNCQWITQSENTRRIKYNSRGQNNGCYAWKYRGKYRAEIRTGGKRINVKGLFDSKDIALETARTLLTTHLEDVTL